MELSLNQTAHLPRVRHVTYHDIQWALRQGWADYHERRGELVFLPIIYISVGILAALVAFNKSLIPFLFPLAAGFTLVGPIAAAGFFELARRRETGQPFGWNHFFDPMARASLWPLLGLLLMGVGVYLAWIWSATQIYHQTLASYAPTTVSDMVRLVFTTKEGGQLLLWGSLVGLGFALVALILATFSVPLAVDKGTDSIRAVTLSAEVFRRNPLTILQWGAIVAALLFVGSIPLFIGLLVVLPWLSYSTWHLYTRAVER